VSVPPALSVVETDGHQTHGTRQAFERDRRRDQRLTIAGWRVIRVTWRQLVREPAQVTRTLIALPQLQGPDRGFEPARAHEALS
jgi:very-short-patch-repair endonuclease